MILIQYQAVTRPIWVPTVVPKLDWLPKTSVVERSLKELFYEIKIIEPIILPSISKLDWLPRTLLAEHPLEGLFYGIKIIEPVKLPSIIIHISFNQHLIVQQTVVQETAHLNFILHFIHISFNQYSIVQQTVIQEIAHLNFILHFIQSSYLHIQSIIKTVISLVSWIPYFTPLWRRAGRALWTVGKKAIWIKNK